MIFCSGLYASESDCPSSVTDINWYTDFCKSAAEDDILFANFKRSPLYTVVLEHVTYNFGKQYLELIKKNYPLLLLNAEQFRTNDLIGNPFVFRFGKYGIFSPTTLRYMKIAGDIGLMDIELKEAKIIEIGAGYGGQCKVLSDFTGFKEYTIVDLPEVLLLVKRYLDAFDIKNVKLLTPDQIDSCGDYDLVISNYAFSECYKLMQDVYLDRIIKNSKHGYMIHNGDAYDHESFYHTEDLLQFLTEYGYFPNVHPEIPQTGGDIEHPNVVLTW